MSSVKWAEQSERALSFGGCQRLSQLWPHKANERRNQCPAWPTTELSSSPNRPTGTFFTSFSNSQATATTAAEGRWDQTPTWGISVPTELRETRWSQRIMWSKSLTLPWGRVSPVCCQQFLKSAQWEKLMALLMFPIALSHFLSSFARLFIFPSPRSTSRLAMYICPSKGNRIKSCTMPERANTAELNYRPLASFPHRVAPHRCDLTRSPTQRIF